MDTTGRLYMRSLAIFDAVARYGSLREAADAFGVVPSCVSQTITRLEAAYGVKLVSSSCDGSSLTQAGMDFWQTAKSVLGRLRLAQRDLADLNAPPASVEILEAA